MSGLHYEFGSRQLNKHGEELCGDNIIFSVLPNFLTLVLSDGLGSGVKANILATLTSKIASHMIAEGLPADIVVQTISQTLPVCNVRKLAYSTFTVAQFFLDGRTHLMEFDNPHAFRLHGRKLRRLDYSERTIEGHLINDVQFKLELGDWLVMVSDGVINAGIGAASYLGWGWDAIATYLERHAHPKLSAQELADNIGERVLQLYEGKPGDDVSIAVIKVRRRRFMTVFTGPPLNREDDEAVVEKLMAARGERVSCGGTTSEIVARVLKRPLGVDLSTASPDVPPMGAIEGLDLTTEGVLTLSKTLENLNTGVPTEALQFKADGASELPRRLLDADEITFLVGRAINPAHQNPDMPRELALKTHIVRQMETVLENLGKTVRLEYF